MTSFKDYFSKQSDRYRQFRPQYPAELYAYLATIAPAHETAWDCATGNGQAAIALTPFFEQVIATDASDRQIQNAMSHVQVTYQVAPAEATPIAASSIDLIVVAQALHWFDRERFWAEVNRVLKPKGAIAVWSYSLTRITPTIDAVVNEFYTDIIGRYWPPERQLVEEGYKTISFPFEELAPPLFEMQTTWSLSQLVGYLDTWSAVQRYKDDHKGQNPLDLIEPTLQNAWGDAEAEKPLHWPLHLRVGCKNLL